MGYYHQEKNTEEYIRMAEGYNGQEIITELTKHLAKNSTVLEIGMGPGTDLGLLGNYYRVTGSDNSEIFIDRYKKNHPNTKLVVLDAVTLETDYNFQGIYSNKVLMHLSRDELKQSIKRQSEILEPNGIICHSFWYGNKEENYDGLIFIYYTAEEIKNLFKDFFSIIKIEIYTEMESEDSLFIIAKKKQKEK